MQLPRKIQRPQSLLSLYSVNKMEEECEECKSWEEDIYWNHFKEFHFCQVLTDDFHHQLVLPRKFAQIMSSKLPEMVTLKGPSGFTWDIAVKTGCDTLSFQDGWEEFVNAFSLEKDDTLIFNYNGKSSFHVLIIDGKNLCEKEAVYFVKKCENVKPICTKQKKRCLGEVEQEEHATGLGSPAKHSRIIVDEVVGSGQPNTMMVVSAGTREPATTAKKSRKVPNDEPPALERHDGIGLSITTPDRSPPGKSIWDSGRPSCSAPPPSSIGTPSSIATRVRGCPRARVSSSSKVTQGRGRPRQGASPSSNKATQGDGRPSFQVSSSSDKAARGRGRPRLAVSAMSAKTTRGRGRPRLTVSHPSMKSVVQPDIEKQWIPWKDKAAPVQFIDPQVCRTATENLPPEKTVEAAAETNKEMLSSNPDKLAIVLVEKSATGDNGVTIAKLPRKRASSSRGEPRKRTALLTRKRSRYLSNRRPVTELEIQEACQMAIRESTEDSFIVVMRPWCVTNKFYMTIPVKWLAKHFTQHREVILRVGEKTWTTKLYYCESTKAGGLCGGWKTFVLENCLEEFDVCLFKLCSQTHEPLIFNVSIFRVVPELTPRSFVLEATSPSPVSS